MIYLYLDADNNYPEYPAQDGEAVGGILMKSFVDGDYGGLTEETKVLVESGRRPEQLLALFALIDGFSWSRGDEILAQDD